MSEASDILLFFRNDETEKVFCESVTTLATKRMDQF